MSRAPPTNSNHVTRSAIWSQKQLCNKEGELVQIMQKVYTYYMQKQPDMLKTCKAHMPHTKISVKAKHSQTPCKSGGHSEYKQ